MQTSIHSRVIDFMPCPAIDGQNPNYVFNRFFEIGEIGHLRLFSPNFVERTNRDDGYFVNGLLIHLWGKTCVLGKITQK